MVLVDAKKKDRSACGMKEACNLRSGGHEGGKKDCRTRKNLKRKRGKRRSAGVGMHLVGWKQGGMGSDGNTRGKR